MRSQAGFVAMSKALRAVRRGGTVETVLDVGVALAAHGEIDRHEQRRAFCGPRPFDHRLAEAAIAEHVELEPERFADRALHVLDRTDRHGGQAELDAGGFGRAGGKHLAITMDQAREPGWRDCERHRDRLAQHCGSKRYLRYVDQHALPQPDGVEFVAVGIEREFVIGTALDVIVDRARDFSPRDPPQILDIGDDGHCRCWKSVVRHRNRKSDH